jgi:glycosyltransferase involved in cell wall biosynthesis
MLLSILICTVPQRKEFLRRLCESLHNQLACSKYKDVVEIIVAEDDFKITTGQKRNILIEKSIGKYVCFIDDDDTISDNYISALLPILEKDTYDCVGWKFRFVFYGEPIGPLGTISLQNTEWLDTIERLCKPICHLSQVRAHIAASVKFPDRSHGEDALWSKEICKLLKNEYFLDELMYNYQACPNFSIAEKKENVENTKSFVFTHFDFEKMDTLNFRHLKFE